jgi:hypothetical protein
MLFTKRLREGVRRGRIRCSVRIWTSPHVKVGGRYQMEEGQIVVDSVVPIGIEDITDNLARESGFNSLEDLLQTAKHGSGSNVYVIRFHYLAPGAWDVPQRVEPPTPQRPSPASALLQRIRRSTAPAATIRNGKGATPTRSRRRKT